MLHIVIIFVGPYSVVVVVVAAVGIITVLYYVCMLDGINNYVVDLFHFPANVIIWTIYTIYIEAGLETLSLLQDELALPVTVPLVSCMNNYCDYG